MLAVLDPGHSEAIPAKVLTNLKRLASSSRDKRSHMVAPSELFALGCSLLDQADHQPDHYHSATMARDGIMIALLACCPVRIANLTQIEIGHHLLFDNDRYLLAFAAAETKTRQSLAGELPPETTAMIDRYLRHYRRILLKRGTGEPTNAFWIDRWGRPMQEHSIRDQIEKRTRDTFGRHVWPHLFRTIAASGFVDLAPDEVSLLPDLLGHADVHTTHRHYVLANAMVAHQAVQDAVLTGRSEALHRKKERSQ
jgi:integrase